jgi:hypothetical protein
LPNDERVVGISDWQAALARAAMNWDAAQERAATFDWRAAFAGGLTLDLDACFGRVIEMMRDLTEEQRVGARDAMRQLAQKYGPTIDGWIVGIVGELLLSEHGVAMRRMAIAGNGEVTAHAAEPTLAKQLAELSCGQVFAIAMILLSVALFADLPIEAQDRVVGLIAVFGVAYGAILKVAAKK